MVILKIVMVGPQTRLLVVHWFGDKFNDILNIVFQVIERSSSLAEAILSKGIQAGQESRVGIYANNRPEVRLQKRKISICEWY